MLFLGSLRLVYVAFAAGWTGLLVPLFVVVALVWVMSGLVTYRRLGAYYRARRGETDGTTGDT